jgi:hypothetical protein
VTVQTEEQELEQFRSEVRTDESVASVTSASATDVTTPEQEQVRVKLASTETVVQALFLKHVCFLISNCISPSSEKLIGMYRSLCPLKSESYKSLKSESIGLVFDHQIPTVTMFLCNLA